MQKSTSNNLSVYVEVGVMEVEIKEVSPLDNNVQDMFGLLDEHNMSHCPPEVCHLTQPEELENINSVLLGVFSGGELIGMGGLKLHSGYAELTRMFVNPANRGKGVSVKLLKSLEGIAKNEGYKIIRLETSEKFKAAYQLDLKYGFKLCAPFGEYITKAHNTYMEKEIAPNNGN